MAKEIKENVKKVEGKKVETKKVETKGDKTNRKTFRLTKSEKDKLKGLVFVLPFIIGCFAFFIYPIFLSVRLSLSEVTNIVGFKMEWRGIDNFVRAFTFDPDFLPMFLEVVRNTLTEFPLTIVLSLIIAVLINKDIKGRALFRIAFFIPFLLGTGEVMRQLLYQGVDKQVLSITDGTIIPYNILNYFGYSVVTAVQNVFGIIVSVLWGSGVQILLFLAALQSISVALYEAAKIDGATEWEIFWKVTIPMISPMLLLNIIYTIVDSFTNIRNPLLEYIQEYGFTKIEFHYGAALGWIYFAFIGLVVAIIFAIMKGYMHTNEVEEVKRRDREYKQRKIITIQRNTRKGA